MPLACTAFIKALEDLDKAFDEVIDGGDFDIRQHWPTRIVGRGSIERLAATLKLRKMEVKNALASHELNYPQEAIASLFEKNGGIEGFRIRSSKSKKRADQLRGKKIMSSMTSEALAWAICPVLHSLMNTPQILPCGHTFDKKTIVNIVRRVRPPSGSCPSCRKRFKKSEVSRNYALEEAIKWYKSLPTMCKNSIDL